MTKTSKIVQKCGRDLFGCVARNFFGKSI